MSKNILGIDLGTSSVKLLLRYKDGHIIKSKATYDEKSPAGWLQAIKIAVSKLDIESVESIGLSSQVGTYIINDKDVIGWDSGVGAEELQYIKNKYPKEKFIEEIAMPYPDILSYPIARFLYIKKNFDDIKSICQPKDYLCKVLTGRCVTDKYSLRGLVHTRTGEYSKFFLDEIGIDISCLPPVVNPEEMIGNTTAECFETLGIPQGIPVYVGLNDFFSSVVGMGITEVGEMFDITGTSEHVGVVCDRLYPDTKMVSGVYFDKFIHYGVTASSGASMDFAIREFGVDGIDIAKCLSNNPPIFTPYLNGERAPVFDSKARGTFFGINSSCTKKDLAYSVLEGVAFGLYHIYESMGAPECNCIKVSGGASKDRVLNTIKAELFNAKVCTLAENDTSALGAVQIVANALGLSDMDFNSIVDEVEPCGKYRDMLLSRYNIYKTLYPSLKDQFKKLSDIRKD